MTVIVCGGRNYTDRDTIFHTLSIQHRHGRSAGMIRNKEMIDCHNPELVIAFPGGSGTEGMKKLALRRGIRVIEYD